MFLQYFPYHMCDSLHYKRSSLRVDDSLLQSLRRIRLVHVIVSLNAATRETFRAIAKKDLYCSVVEHLRAWVRLGEQHDLGRFPVFASFVVMRSNFRELPRFLQQAREWGAEVQLLDVLGDREGEDVFARRDLHAELAAVLHEAARTASAQARGQIERIQAILRARAAEAGDHLLDQGAS